MSEHTATVGATPQTAETDRLVHRVVHAVADAEGVEPIELDPLYDAVGSDVRDSLVRPRLTLGEVSEPTAEVRFEYHGYEVRITDDGRVRLTDQ